MNEDYTANPVVEMSCFHHCGPPMSSVASFSPALAVLSSSFAGDKSDNTLGGTGGSAARGGGLCQT